MSALRLKIPWLGFGSPGWIRTSDQLLRRQMLFPLSYRQIKSPRRLTSGLNSLLLGTTERIPSVRDESIQFFREMQVYFLNKLFFMESIIHLVTFERIESAIDSCLWHSATNSSKSGWSCSYAAVFFISATVLTPSITVENFSLA